MKIGDKVKIVCDIDEKETEIIATAFDEQGEKIYVLKGYSQDYYEKELAPVIPYKFKNLEEIIELLKEEIDAGDENASAILDIVDLKELRYLLKKEEMLEKQTEMLVDLLLEIKKERNEYKQAYKDYQELGKEYSKLEDKCEELEKTIKALQERGEASGQRGKKNN